VSLLVGSEGGLTTNFRCQDIRSFAESFKFARRLAQQEPFKSILVGKCLLAPYKFPD
jgi:hypothetical protein